ncbi:TolB-like 6-blade propeller-like [Parapedobacter koreensis]|uniref:TolB-like 6-blade propeller-like n=2 Tax=Parapedobacter koreensis TaxID=332977 RepID=A0A1H7F1R8_9SPHI|nr:TolB-like 6-blade propeller-like [Parapedobacter koreensis]
MPDVYLKYPFRVRLNDTSLYVMDIHPIDYYCHEFSYPAMEHKRSFAKRGEAPNEFLDAENIRLDHQGRFWVLDANRKKIVHFGKDNTSTPQETIMLDEAFIRTLDFDLLDDSTFIVPDYTGLHRLSLVNLDGKFVRNLFSIPASSGGGDMSDSNVPLAQAWRPFLRYNSQHGIAVLVTQLGQVLEIYDIRNERIVNIVKPIGMEPHFVTKGNYAVPTGIMGYSDIHVGRAHIYAVFWGHSFDDIKRQKQTKEGGRYIHVFDLQGNPIRQYLLDRYITGFHVDEENRKIIGLDVNADQPIVEYTYLP